MKKLNLNLVTIKPSNIEKSIDFNNIPGFKFIGKALHYTGFAYSGANSTSSIHKGKVLLTQVVQIYFEVDDVVYFVDELAKKCVKIQN